MIKFNALYYTGKEKEYIEKAMARGSLQGNQHFSKSAERLLTDLTGSLKCILLPSCTSALEMSALLLDIQPGDEVIMPSYTFVSTANAFALRGARIKFVDVEPVTMNLDVADVERAITSRTKAIVPVHYGGTSCDMYSLKELADAHHLFIVEDAAQSIGADCGGQHLGTFGSLGCISFHETKNIHAGGEGGALLINDPRLLERADIMREKGTDRIKFLDGEVDKYTWQQLGSSFLLGELSAAFLLAQLEELDVITANRVHLWGAYEKGLKPLMETMGMPDYSKHNGHLFYIKTRDRDERAQLIAHLKAEGIQTASHYVPLHSSNAGQRYGDFIGEDKHTTVESERLLRLPLHGRLREEDVEMTIHKIYEFYEGDRHGYKE